MKRQVVLGLVTVMMVVGVIATQPKATAAEDAAMKETAVVGPELIVVKFHADWCGSCKAMGGTFEDLINKLDSEPVLFVELDQTTTSGRKQAGFLMQAMGGGAVWDELGGKTGFMLLIDPQDMSVVGKLTKEMGFKEMVKTIGEARGV